MRPTRSLGNLVLCLTAVTPLAAAWPTWLPDLDLFVARRDTSSSTSSPAPSQTPSPSPTGSSSKQATSSVNLNTASVPTDSAGNVISTGTGSSQATHTDFDPRDPAGGVVMLTPAATLGTQLYRIGDEVTWAWNYTNLQANPTAIDVIVSCPKATQTWTLTQNMTFQTLGSLTWDTEQQATAVQSPLLTEEYMLIIYDADSSISAVPSAGYLGPFNQFTFGLYAPQPYSNLSDWNCATCVASAAFSLDKRAVGLAMSMSLITLLSFTWFVTGLRVLW